MIGAQPLGSQGPASPVQPYHKLFIFHTKKHFLIVGARRGGPNGSGQFGLLRVVRQDGAQLQAAEDPVTYTLPELNNLLRATHAACSQQGGLQFVAKAYGLVGCIRFTASYYLLIVTRRSHVGSICGHKVHAVRDVALLPLGAPMGVSQLKDSATERRYRKLLMGVDLTRNFYFSLTYNLAATLQHNYNNASSRVSEGAPFSAFPTSAPTSAAPAASSAIPEDLPSFAASAYSSADFDSMFVWNSYLTWSLRRALGTSTWVLALVHGAWDQRRLSVLGRPVVVTLLARRSRYFAGTRFRKRGLSDQGNVANEVEVEQICDAGYDHGTGLPLISSIVQVRGSVPLFWSQQPTSLSPKPDIILQRFDPLYQATALHFADLRERYGAPCVCLNLLKSRERRPRETRLRREMAHAIHVLNTQAGPGRRQDLIHIPWDFQKHARQAGAGLLSEISAITLLSLEATGLFVHNPSAVHLAHLLGQPSHPSQPPQAPAEPAWAPPAQENAPNPPGGTSPPPTATPGSHSSSSVKATRSPAVLLQQGVLRTNCIDCLDRTNVAQFAYGLVAFGLQLYLLGIAESPEIDSDSSMALVLMEQYELMGNTLALQYGGSDAHSLFFQRKKGASETSSRSKDLITSIQRFYSNTYADAEKQDAINLVLGNYIPGRPGQPELWELETDAYLHNLADMQASNLVTGNPPSRSVSRRPSSAGLALRPGPAALPSPPTTARPPLHTRAGTPAGTPASTGGAAAGGGAVAAPSHPAPVVQDADTTLADHPSTTTTTTTVAAHHSPGGEAQHGAAAPPTTPVSGQDAPVPDTSTPQGDGTAAQLVAAAQQMAEHGGAGAQQVVTGGVPSTRDDAAPSGLDAGDAAAAPGGMGAASAEAAPRTTGAAGGASTPAAPVQQGGLRRVPASSVSLLSLSSDEEDPGLQSGSGTDSQGLRVGNVALEGAARPGPSTSAGMEGRALDLAPADNTWTFTGLWSSLFGAPARPPPALPQLRDGRPGLQLFDVVLAQPCRKARPVRLYTLSRRANDQSLLMWQALQNAFSFFWTLPEAEDSSQRDGSAHLHTASGGGGGGEGGGSGPGSGHSSANPSQHGAAPPPAPDGRSSSGARPAPRGFYAHPPLPMPHYLCVALAGRSTSVGADSALPAPHSTTARANSRTQAPKPTAGGGSPGGGWVLVGSPDVGSGFMRLERAGRAGPGARYAASLLHPAPTSRDSTAAAGLQHPTQQRSLQQATHPGGSTGNLSVVSAFIDGAGCPSHIVAGPSAQSWAPAYAASRRAALDALVALARRYNQSLVLYGPPGASAATSLAATPRALSPQQSSDFSRVPLPPSYSVGGTSGGGLSARPSVTATTTATSNMAYLLNAQDGFAHFVPPSTPTLKPNAGKAAGPARPAASGIAGGGAGGGSATAVNPRGGITWGHGQEHAPNALFTAAREMSGWDNGGKAVAHAGCLPLFWDPGAQLSAAHWSDIASLLAESDDPGLAGGLRVWVYGQGHYPWPVSEVATRVRQRPRSAIGRSRAPLVPPGTGTPGLQMSHTPGEAQSPSTSPPARVMGKLFKPGPPSPSILSTGSLWPASLRRSGHGAGPPGQTPSPVPPGLGPPRGVTRSPGPGGGRVSPWLHTPTGSSANLTALAVTQAGSAIVPVAGPQAGYAGSVGYAGGASMAALGRVPTGIAGPLSVAPLATSAAPGGVGPATSAQASSVLWELAALVNPTTLLNAISSITGTSPARDTFKPPIPLLNDFIEIGPQAQATLAARQAQHAQYAALLPGARPGTPAGPGGAQPGSGGGYAMVYPDPALAAGLAVRTSQPGSASGLVARGFRAGGLDTSPQGGVGDSGWVAVDEGDVDEATGRDVNGGQEGRPRPGPRPPVLGLEWDAAVGGWLPPGLSGFGPYVNPDGQDARAVQEQLGVSGHVQAVWHAVPHEELWTRFVVPPDTPARTASATGQPPAQLLIGVPAWAQWAAGSSSSTTSSAAVVLSAA